MGGGIVIVTQLALAVLARLVYKMLTDVGTLHNQPRGSPELAGLGVASVFILILLAARPRK